MDTPGSSGRLSADGKRRRVSHTNKAIKQQTYMSASAAGLAVIARTLADHVGGCSDSMCFSGVVSCSHEEPKWQLTC